MEFKVYRALGCYARSKGIALLASLTGFCSLSPESRDEAKGRFAVRNRVRCVGTEVQRATQEAATSAGNNCNDL